MKKVFIQTHGCQMNEYDSAKMLELLGEKSNFQTTENEAEADLLVLNTCSIREKAQERVFHQVGRWKALKENNPNLKIAVGGCVASQEGEAISKIVEPKTGLINTEQALAIIGKESGGVDKVKLVREAL